MILMSSKYPLLRTTLCTADCWQRGSPNTSAMPGEMGSLQTEYFNLIDTIGSLEREAERKLCLTAPWSKLMASVMLAHAFSEGLSCLSYFDLLTPVRDGSRKPKHSESLLCWPACGDMKTHQVFFSLQDLSLAFLLGPDMNA